MWVQVDYVLGGIGFCAHGDDGDKMTFCDDYGVITFDGLFGWAFHSS